MAIKKDMFSMATSRGNMIDRPKWDSLAEGGGRQQH